MFLFQNDTKKSTLELENAVIKMGFITFGAMKSLCNILKPLLELLLVPKPHKRHSNVSTSDSKDEEEEEFTKIDDLEEFVCPNCGKSNPSGHDECVHCSKNSSMQAALAEVFAFLAKVRHNRLKSRILSDFYWN